MTRRRTSQIFLLIFTLAAFFSLSFAQTPKIGVVNSQEVLEKSTEGKKVMAQLQEKDRKNQGDVAKRDEEIRKLETKLNTQRLTLTDEALMQLSSDLERKRTDRKRFTEDSMREMQELTQRLFTKIQNELLPIIEDIGKEKDIDIIFDFSRSGAIYFNPSVDVTDEVIKRYDVSKSEKK